MLQEQTLCAIEKAGATEPITVVKALAEQARDAVADLRGARYDLEELLSEEIRKGSTQRLEWSLCVLLDLATAANHAQDRARTAVREGLNLWRVDDAAFHAQRRLMDPSLAARPDAGDGADRQWFATYDAAVRQCTAMERQLADEATSLHELLNAASTIAVTRDARAQDIFNAIAAVGAVVLGLPALFLALYGVSVKDLPLSGWGMLAATALIAGAVTLVLPGSRSDRRSRITGGGIAASLVVVALLFIASCLR